MLHQVARHIRLQVLEEATKYGLINYLPPPEGEEGIKFLQPLGE